LLPQLLENVTNASQKLEQANSFISCLQAQDISDMKASELRGIITSLYSVLETSLTKFDEKLSKINKNVWEEMLSMEQYSNLAFILNERRKQAKEKLPMEQEALIHALAVDGYH